jgi:sialate O-acetylesterase
MRMNIRNNFSESRLIRLLIGVLIVVFHSDLIWSNIRLPHLIGNNMVLQRNAPITIWGWSDAREKITVQFEANTLTTRADKNGSWKMVFPSMQAGGPYSMNIHGNNTIRLENILIGEVWICSGQSNMEWTVAQSNNSLEEIEKANYPEIRLFDVPNKVELKPVGDVSGGEWKACSPSTVANFSAIGYFFGRNLFIDLKVPIGLISTNWGGTLIECWTSDDALATVPACESKVIELRNLDPKKMEDQQKERFDKIQLLIQGNSDGLADGKALWAEPGFNDADWAAMKVPGLWEQSLLPGLDGVVWFRREVEVPEDMLNTSLTLSLGKIDDSDMTWINGILVGKTESRYDQERNYELPGGVIQPGKNIITVRVEDTGGGGGFWSEEQVLCLKSPQKSIALAGDWKFKISPVHYSFFESIAGPNDFPSTLFNGMIHPLLNYAVKGAIWYQGESNAENAFLYRSLLPLMINNWREKWNNPELVFLIVQLANFKQASALPIASDWAELREAQLMALSVPKTGMAVTIDIGEANNIHPRNKQDVGYRLSLAALKTAYNQNLVYSGPIYKSMQIKGNTIELEFNHTGSGLVARDKYGYPKGFSIAGADHQFIWAKAYITGNRVVVYSDAVSEPVAVRYAWADNPDDANLYNVEGLPASPFRTDSLKGITEK